VFERALGWAQGKILRAGGFLRKFCTAGRSFPGEQSSVFFPQNLLSNIRVLCMSFSFEILSEGSLVYVWKPSFSFLLDWTGVHLLSVIRDPFTDTEYLFFWLV